MRSDYVTHGLFRDPAEFRISAGAPGGERGAGQRDILIALGAGQKLWASRFGRATSIRVEGTSDAGGFGRKLRAAIVNLMASYAANEKAEPARRAPQPVR